MTGHPELTLRWQDGRTEAGWAQEDQTVLEAVEAADLDLSFSCRTGACSTCAGQLIIGSISYTRLPRALKRRHRSTGYILCCIARPQTDCRIEVGACVQSELVANPWK